MRSHGVQPLGHTLGCNIERSSFIYVKALTIIEKRSVYEGYR